MDPGHMISWSRYGYRMIGSADERAEYVRRRYMGAGLNLNASNFNASAAPFVGEGSAPPPPKVISFHLGPVKVATPPPKKIINFHLSPPPAYVPPAPAIVTAPAPMPDAAAAPEPATFVCPAVPLLPALGGMAGGALLMYLVGLAMREAKKKGRRR